MTEVKEQPAILMLEDGSVFRGKAAGKIGMTTGEICFNTGMTGYQEIFTDPSYYGQLLVCTNAHIGNYGTTSKESQSGSIKIAGLICKNFTDEYSRPQAEQSIQQYFEQEDLVGISDVDTRAIVRHIRSKGAMNAIISSSELDEKKLKARLKEVPNMKGLELASAVSTREAYELGDPDGKFKVAVMDFGVKQNILDCLTSRSCYLKVFPAKTKLEEVTAWKPDGYFLSNGPGDPAAMGYAVDLARGILEKDEPLFGICLGHQLLALAADISTFKMHHGHRGINHPVKNLETGYCEITSQNHGFGVDPEAFKKNSDRVEATHINLNDDSIEGLRVKGKRAFSVQYHPEASPGPHDARYLFDRFVKLMES
ncbi:MAG: glutamine-hydrolyzing carbamoyl-phosphate synthase small subunit [Saprospiraceae bacterium]|nr:glutamine-hydrolyzing carbamoyl-phosphate synthase small subunit [Saprospiraceae bacterium]